MTTDTITETQLTDKATEIVAETPEMESIIDFINENEIKMHVLLAHENPYRNQQQTEGLVHWSCKLINKENQFFVIYFSKGAGIRRWCEPPQTGLGNTIPLHVPHDKINQTYDGPMPPFDTDHDKLTYLHCSQVEPPFLIEVLDVLAKDVWIVEQSGGFNKWAQAMGSNGDSMMARGVFDIVCKQRIQLMGLLGEDAHHKLLYEIERINPIKFAENEETEEISQDST